VIDLWCNDLEELNRNRAPPRRGFGPLDSKKIIIACFYQRKRLHVYLTAPLSGAVGAFEVSFGISPGYCEDKNAIVKAHHVRHPNHGTVIQEAS
jgi:hypothetical protein